MVLNADLSELCKSTSSAVLPWDSIDASIPIRDELPQQRIDICLMCQHCASHCESCTDWHNKGGRPKKEIDADLLREMLQLRKCNKEMCAALGVSTPTLMKAKKKLFEEDFKK